MDVTRYMIVNRTHNSEIKSLEKIERILILELSQ